MQREVSHVFADRFVRSIKERLGLWFEINESEWDANSISEAHLTDGESFVLISVTKSQISDRSWKVVLADSETLWIDVSNRSDSRKKFDLREVVVQTLSFVSSSDLRLDSMLVVNLATYCVGRQLVNTVVGPFYDAFGDANVQMLPRYQGILIDNPEMKIVTDPNACWFQVNFPNGVPLGEVCSTLEPLVGRPMTLKLGRQDSFQVTGELSRFNASRISFISRGNGFAKTDGRGDVHRRFGPS